MGTEVSLQAMPQSYSLVRVEVTEDFFPFLSAVAEMLEGIMKCLREGSISC